MEDLTPVKKKKSLGISKTKILLETSDIYDRDDSSNSRSSLEQNERSKSGDDEKQSGNEENHSPKSGDENKNKRQTKPRIRKPTKSVVLETERKMQELSRTEHLVLPIFVPKPLESWHALEKRSRQELMNEIRAKNPTFTPQDPDLPELPIADIESTAASTLADLTSMIEETPVATSNASVVNKLSRFLNPDILKKEPTIRSRIGESNSMIDLSDVKPTRVRPTVKPSINLSLDCAKPPSTSKQLVEMQKQLGIRMQAKRAAMLAENAPHISEPEIQDEDEEEEEDDKSVDSSSENNDIDSEILPMDKEDDDPNTEALDEETRNSTSENDNCEDEEAEEEEEEDVIPSSSTVDPTRPSLTSILTRIDLTAPPQSAQSEPDGQAMWFDSMRPAQFDQDTELLCSGVFGGENAIPLSQNYAHVEPLAFSPLPPTPPVAGPIEYDEEPDIQVRRAKVRLLDDDEDDDSRQLISEKVVDDDDEEEEDDTEFQEESNDAEPIPNEELLAYKNQLFEYEAEESGSELGDKDQNDDDDASDSDENDEELKQFIDTTASVLDEHELDNIAKVHLKLKNKEDEQQLKLLKEQYLDFDGDDEGKRPKLSRAPMDDDEDEDDPDYNNNEVEDDEEEEEEDDNSGDMKNRLSELERQRSMQDSQAEELHLNEDLDSIGQDSPMFQKGLALKQKKVQKTAAAAVATIAETQSSLIESTSKSTIIITTDSNPKKQNQARTVTRSSVLLAERYSSTLFAPVTKNNVLAANISTSETRVTTKKQHNPRQHVFAASTTNMDTNENQNPGHTTSAEKRANSADKTSASSVKRFKQTVQPTTTTTSSSTSVFSALADSFTTRH